jgi:hypothetical protein
LRAWDWAEVPRTLYPMKKAVALLSALLFVGIGLLSAATAELHANNGKAPKKRTTNPELTTFRDLSVPKNGDVMATTPGNAPIIGWLAVKRGLPESELKRQLGVPRIIESKGDHELWRFVTGAVWVKDQHVIAWMQVILD